MPDSSRLLVVHDHSSGVVRIDAPHAVIDIAAADVPEVAARLARIAGDLIVPVTEIIGTGEIRRLAGGITYRTLALWREGRNTSNAGPFPEPIKELDIGPIFDRRAVCAWLERHA